MNIIRYQKEMNVKDLVKLPNYGVTVPERTNKEYFYTSKNRKLVKTSSAYCGDTTNISLMCEYCFNIMRYKLSIMSLITLENDYNTPSENTNYVEIISRNKFFGNCPFCNSQDAEFYKIDANISEIISLLNKKGFLTNYCCEGHYFNKSFYVPYIVFTYDTILQYIDYLPDSWSVDFEFYKSNGNVRITAGNVKDINYPYYKQEIIDELFEFVSKLPYIQIID